MTTICLPRLRSRVETLARFGALEGGGVTRPAFSPPHEQARAWLLDEIRRAGLTAWVDAAANTFGGLGMDRFDAERPVVLTGSHIDSVPRGGILDGALGVLAGLECLQVIRDVGGSRRLPLALAAWTDEEGRYGSLFGSRAFTGLLDLGRIAELAASDGERLADAMARAGFDAGRAGEARAVDGSVAAYVELHIEQGPRLEAAGIPIGVVEAIVGIRRTRFVFIGQADHAGTTPMERRRDAFLAAAEWAVKARDLVVERGGPTAVTNFGVVTVRPGVSNIVPERAEVVQEIRCPDAGLLDVLGVECRGLADDVARRRGVELDVQPMSASKPARCSPRVADATEQAARGLGLTTLRLHSGAGHDAQNLATVTDAGMIFIPSAGGRSHRPDEMSGWDAIERGANVLLHTLLLLARG